MFVLFVFVSGFRDGRKCACLGYFICLFVFCFCPWVSCALYWNWLNGQFRDNEVRFEFSSSSGRLDPLTSTALIRPSGHSISSVISANRPVAVRHLIRVRPLWGWHLKSPELISLSPVSQPSHYREGIAPAGCLWDELFQCLAREPFMRTNIRRKL